MPVMAKAKGKFRDRLLGIVVRVSVGDKVVKTYSTNNHLLDLEPSRLAKNQK